MTGKKLTNQNTQQKQNKTKRKNKTKQNPIASDDEMLKMFIKKLFQIPSSKRLPSIYK